MECDIKNKIRLLFGSKLLWGKEIIKKAKLQYGLLYDCFLRQLLFIIFFGELSLF